MSFIYESLMDSHLLIRNEYTNQIITLTLKIQECILMEIIVNIWNN